MTYLLLHLWALAWLPASLAKTWKPGTPNPSPAPKVSSAPEIQCDALDDKLTDLIREIESIERKQDRVRQKFQQAAKADFAAQIEGDFDLLQRRQAIKLGFAKRQLANVLDQKSLELSSIRQVFCQKCPIKPTERDDTVTKCQKCPEAKGCL